MDAIDKYRIVEKIIQTEDDLLLLEIKELLGLSQNDFWNDLPETVKSKISEAESQLNQGGGISHESVWKEVSGRIKK
jgi:hypothetical protein